MPNLLYKNATVHYADHGKGPALVLLHGFLEDHSMWNKIVKTLNKSYRVIYPDLIGHGKTDNLGYIHSMEEQAKMLKFLLTQLKVRQCTVIGHSMGGYVAIAFAELFPEMMLGLCLMNSTSYADTDEKKHNRDRGIAAVKQNHKTFIRLAIPSLFSIENRLVFKAQINQITESALLMSKQGVIAAIEGMKVRKDRSHILTNSAYPILMVIGEKDPVLDFDSQLKQSENENIQTAIFADGHMSHIENEQELIQVFTNFL